MSEALEGWTSPSDASTALGALEATARRWTLTGATAEQLDRAIARLKTAAEAPQPPPTRAAPAGAKKKPKANAATARGRDDAAPRAAGPAAEAIQHRSFRLTPSRGPLIGSGTRRVLLYIAASVVCLFLWIAYRTDKASFVPSSSSPPSETRAQQKARCGDLSPLRCRLKGECDSGKADGCFRLGLSLELGQSDARDVPGAVPLYDKACSMGSGEACHALANLYRNGYHVPVDRVRSGQLDRSACSRGVAVACATATN